MLVLDFLLQGDNRTGNDSQIPKILYIIQDRMLFYVMSQLIFNNIEHYLIQVKFDLT